MWSLTFIILGRQFFTYQPLVAISFIIQLIIAGCFNWWLNKQPHQIHKNLNIALLISLFIQILLSLFQLINQKPVFPYYVLGEPSFAPYLSMTRNFFWGKEKILAYGSTAHPNVLAGIMVIFFLILLNRTMSISAKNPKQTRFWLPLAIASVAIVTVLFVTQSLSALLSLIIGSSFIILKRWKNDFLSKSLTQTFIAVLLLTTVVASPLLISQLAQNRVLDPSATRRSLLNQAAWMMFLNHPLSGVGLNQFVIHLEKYSTSTEVVRFIQPAHHVGLLLLAETGLLGVAGLGCLIFSLTPPKRTALLQALFIVSPILFLDHYLYTLLPGNLAFILLINQLESSPPASAIN